MTHNEEMESMDGDDEGEGKDELSGLWGMLTDEQKVELKKLWEKTDEKVNYIG